MHCGGATRIFAETLTGLERKLDPRSFLRMHRCRIVNVSWIRSIHSMGHGAYALELRANVRLTTGRQFRGAVEALLSR
jgi:two-component system, LytTR family, response regulator